MKTASAASAPPSAERAGVAHEDVGREAVVPEEPDAGPEQRGAEDREVERWSRNVSVPLLLGTATQRRPTAAHDAARW